MQGRLAGLPHPSERCIPHPKTRRQLEHHHKRLLQQQTVVLSMADPGHPCPPPTATSMAVDQMEYSAARQPATTIVVPLTEEATLPVGSGHPHSAASKQPPLTASGLAPGATLMAGAPLTACNVGNTSIGVPHAPWGGAAGWQPMQALLLAQHLAAANAVTPRPHSAASSQLAVQQQRSKPRCSKPGCKGPDGQAMFRTECLCKKSSRTLQRHRKQDREQQGS
jgi:hypothetical protein